MLTFLNFLSVYNSSKTILVAFQSCNTPDYSNLDGMISIGLNIYYYIYIVTNWLQSLIYYLQKYIIKNFESAKRGNKTYVDNY